MSINSIDYKEFENNKIEILSILADKNILLFRHIPTNDKNVSLLNLCLNLGIPTETISRFPYVENGFVHLVKTQTIPISNKYENIILSTIADEFNLHTDEYFNNNPADYVVLHCIEPDKNGEGISSYSSLSDIIAEIPLSMIEFLKNNNFPCRNRNVSILWQEKNKFKIRFNPYEILSCYNNETNIIPDAIQNIVDMINSLALKHKKQLFLNSGDCLVLNNKEVLHGRTGFSEGSNRIFKRVRLLKK